MKLSQIKEASHAIEDGDWIASPDLDGVSFQVRGMDSSPCRASVQTHLKRLNLTKKKRLSPSDQDLLYANIIYDAGLLDWKGIHDDSGEVKFDKIALKEMLFSDDNRRETNADFLVLNKAIVTCMQMAGEADLEFEEEEEKNSGNSSSGAKTSAKGASG